MRPRQPPTTRYYVYSLWIRVGKAKSKSSDVVDWERFNSSSMAYTVFVVVGKSAPIIVLLSFADWTEDDAWNWMKNIRNSFTT